MRMKKAVKLILPVILLALMGAGGTVRGDDGMGTMAVTGTRTYRVCLPPAWSLKLPTSTRFESALGGEAILDCETGLVWEKSPDPEITSRTWAEAIAYAYDNTVGGRKGWRLPTVEELASLVDTTQINLALPSGHPFTNVQSSYYWSSTTHVNDTSNAWHVYFYNGGVGHDDKNSHYYVWCVRGGHGHDAP